MPPKVSADILAAAIEGFEAQKDRINGQIAGLRAMLSGGPAESVVAPAGAPTKHQVSAAARRRTTLAQKARWTRIRGESEPAAPSTPEPTPKRRISEDGMKRIIAATKKRWRLAKAAKAQEAATKKAAAAGKKAAVKKAKKAAPKQASGD